MKKNIFLKLGLFLFISLVFISIYGFFFSNQYEAIDLMNIESSPSPDHIFGTDDLGRDILTRLLFASSVSMGIGFLATIFQLVIGVTVGIVAGLYGGKVDFFLMRLVDVMMCFPMFLVASAIAAVMGPNIRNLILIIALLSWTGTARIIRADTIQIKQSDFILASKLANFSILDLIYYHIIPNVMPNIYISATLSMANAIIMEASLSFLGLGVKLPMPSLGNMLSNAQNIRSLQYQWWTWLPAGILIVLIVLSINFVGEGLRIKYSAKEG